MGLKNFLWVYILIIIIQHENDKNLKHQTIAVVVEKNYNEKLQPKLIISIITNCENRNYFHQFSVNSIFVWIFGNICKLLKLKISFLALFFDLEENHKNFFQKQWKFYVQPPTTEQNHFHQERKISAVNETNNRLDQSESERPRAADVCTTWKITNINLGLLLFTLEASELTKSFAERFHKRQNEPKESFQLKSS